MPEQKEDKSIGDFIEVAQEAARVLSEAKGMSDKGIPNLLGRRGMQGKVNCYPGTDTDNCYPIAFFVCLHSRRHAKGNGHLHFRKMIDILVQHMQCTCEEKTICAVIITDSWDARAWEERSAEIAVIKERKFLEAYLVAEGQAVQIPV